LNERTTAQSDQPVSWFATHTRERRRLDTAWTLAALHRALGGQRQTEGEERLTDLENRLVAGAKDLSEPLTMADQASAQALTERLLPRAPTETPGYMVLNPCSFTRRVALEVEGITTPLPLTGPLKACQLDGDKARLVVEVPPLGFAWF